MDRLLNVVLLLIVSLVSNSLYAESRDELYDKAQAAVAAPTEVVFKDEQNGFEFTKAMTGYYFFSEKRKRLKSGYTLSYFDLTGAYITVYVYKGEVDIADGVGEPITKELKNALYGIKMGGKYVEVSRNKLAPILSPDYAQLSVLGKTKEGQQVKDYTMIRGQRGHFVKVRITGTSPRLEERVAGFMIALSKAIAVDNATLDWSESILKDEKTSFDFPKMISQHYAFKGKNNYDETCKGYQLNYAGIHGTGINICVYDAGLKGISTGTKATEIRDQLRISTGDMKQWSSYGRVEELIEAPPLSLDYLQRSYIVHLKDGRKLKTYTLLRGQNGHFVKVSAFGTAEHMESRIQAALSRLVKVIGIEKSVKD